MEVEEEEVGVEEEEEEDLVLNRRWNGSRKNTGEWKLTTELKIFECKVR